MHVLPLGAVHNPGGLVNWIHGRIVPEVRQGLNLRRGGHQSHIPGVSHSVFAACESPPTGEEYRASSTSKRGTLEVINQAGNPNPNN